MRNPETMESTVVGGGYAGYRGVIIPGFTHDTEPARFRRALAIERNQLLTDEKTITDPQLFRAGYEPFPVTHKPKVLVLGYGRHGKDTVSEILRDRFGLTFQSSSLFCAENVVRPALEAEGVFYDSVADCYADRHSTDKGFDMRTFWFETIKAYNEPDGSRLAREMMATYDIYCGMRNIEEFDACKEDGIFDLIIWVDASERVDYIEPESSCTITKDCAQVVIYNNGTLEDLDRTVVQTFRAFMRGKRFT